LTSSQEGGIRLADVLSQNEIDALLNALDSGEIDTEEIKNEEKVKKVRTYDFKRPNKFSKEHLRTINLVHENYARLLTTYLAASLRTYVQIKVFYTEQMSYSEFMSSIPTPTIIAITDLSPLKGSCILGIDSFLVFATIDRLLGGPGVFNNTVRSLTEIEETIIKKVIREMLKILGIAWENIMEITPELLDIETNPQFVQLVSANEAVALVTFNGKIGETEGLLNLCIPYIVIEPFINKLSTRFWLSNNEKEISESNKDGLGKIMGKTSLPVIARLGGSSVSVRDFLDMQIGDVIQLDKKIDEPLEIVVGNKVKFFGHPGTKKNHIAVKIVDTVKEESV
jgi:flagellar motor switch protein FliM